MKIKILFSKSSNCITGRLIFDNMLIKLIVNKNQNLHNPFIYLESAITQLQYFVMK